MPFCTALLQQKPQITSSNFIYFFIVLISHVFHTLVHYVAHLGLEKMPRKTNINFYFYFEYTFCIYIMSSGALNKHSVDLATAITHANME